MCCVLFENYLKSDWRRKCHGYIEKPHIPSSGCLIDVRFSVIADVGREQRRCARCTSECTFLRPKNTRAHYHRLRWKMRANRYRQMLTLMTWSTEHFHNIIINWITTVVHDFGKSHMDFLSLAKAERVRVHCFDNLIGKQCMKLLTIFRFILIDRNSFCVHSTGIIWHEHLPTLHILIKCECKRVEHIKNRCDASCIDILCKLAHFVQELQRRYFSVVHVSFGILCYFSIVCLFLRFVTSKHREVSVEITAFAMLHRCGTYNAMPK